MDSTPDHGARSPAAAGVRTVPAIMVVGTTSNAGKSVVAAALCRYFARRGRAVAPFKAQNMALNSFVTEEGGEMGRAQVVQAAAAGVRPHTDMNPVLLKPMGERRGSQVIVDGHPIGMFPAREYYAMKTRMRRAAHEAYDRLAQAHDLIILEGAGSPAEINLLADDFVNMDMADYAHAATILVADIDRGGVFAHIYGTVNLLPPAHRRLMKGVIINKFRGDLALLGSGPRDIASLTGIPVLGILPYVRDLRIEDEDSLGLDNRSAPTDAILDLVVVRLPCISNTTDFLDLEHTPGVRVRYLTDPGPLGRPDLIVLPGTKNTRADLHFLRETGWAAALSAAAAARVPLFGICGGYQVLGQHIHDPDGVEGLPGSDDGLCLLPLTTVLEPRKELAQVRGVTTTACPFAAAGTAFSGYEIHAGRTTVAPSSRAPLSIVRRRADDVCESDGAMSDDGLVFGCYIHGLFDVPELRRQLIDWLCRRKGIASPLPEPPTHQPVDEFDRLANLLEQHVDMQLIEQWANRRE